MSDQKVHRNNIYGKSNTKASKEENPAIPAATVILLREREAKVEVLMLQKNTDISFGGMWVFPGGRIDDEDHEEGGVLETAARNAAVRETFEETGLELNPEGFVWFSHWVPPPATRKRFSTWFFAADADIHDAVTVDGQEILKHRWINPAEALAYHTENKIDLVPPTWVTLYLISQHASIKDILQHLKSVPQKFYETHVVFNDDNIPMAVWQGDSAYETSDIKAEGADRHRLTLAKSGYVFEHTIEGY